MPTIPKHIETEHTLHVTEIILEKLGYEKAEESINAPEFNAEHIAELVSRGIIPIDCVREKDGTVYIHKDAAAILSQAYQDLTEEESEEDNESAISDVVRRVERNFNRLVDAQIAQLEISLAAYNEKSETEHKSEDKDQTNWIALRKKLAKLKKLYGR